MSLKIVGALEEKIKGLVLEGYTNEYVAKQVDLSQGAVLGWCNRNGLTLGKYRNPIFREKEIRQTNFVSCISLNHRPLIRSVCMAMRWTSQVHYYPLV